MLCQVTSGCFLVSIFKGVVLLHHPEQPHNVKGKFFGVFRQGDVCPQPFSGSCTCPTRLNLRSTRMYCHGTHIKVGPACLNGTPHPWLSKALPWTHLKSRSYRREAQIRPCARTSPQSHGTAVFFPTEWRFHGFSGCRGAFSHNAGTAPIIKLFIPQTPLKTMHLQKHA